MEVDLSGSGPQALGPINATLASSGSAVSYAVMACADDADPGQCRLLPPGAGGGAGGLDRARPPSRRPVANRIAATHRLATTLLGALHQAVPDRVPAAYYGVSYVCTFQTVGATASAACWWRSRSAAAAAHPAQDGLNAYSCGMHNNANIPVEMIESELPLTVAATASCRTGRATAGSAAALGLVREWRIDCAEAVFTANLERFKLRPYGLAGGGPALRGGCRCCATASAEALPSKVGNLRLRRGDVIRLETSGGGGFGDPAHRPDAARAADRTGGYVTAG